MLPEHHLKQALRLLQQSRSRIALCLCQKNHCPTPEEIALLHTLQQAYDEASLSARRTTHILQVRMVCCLKKPLQQ